MDYLSLNNMQFHAYHGVFEQEKQVGNTYYIDMKIYADFSKACKSDLVEDTINYASVFNEIQKEMQKPCHLIEHLAENICTRIKAGFRSVQSIEIKLTKNNPPIEGQMDNVSIILFR